MPAEEISISDTTTPTMTSAPPTRRPGQHGRNRGGNDHADEALAQRRAHAARGEQQLRIDGLDAGGGGEHGRQEAIERRERDLGFRADAEPHREDRIEDDERHGIEAGNHRHDQHARARQAADDGAEQDAAAAGERHRDRRPRRASPPARGRIRPPRSSRRPASRTATAGTVPGSGRCAAGLPRARSGPSRSAGAAWLRSSLPHADLRMCRQMRSRRLPNASPLSMS